MDCEKGNEMKGLRRLARRGNPMKQLKTVCIRYKTRLYSLHRDHFPDIPQRTIYGWSKDPATIPPPTFAKIAKALGLTTDGLIEEIWGSEEKT